MDQRGSKNRSGNKKNLTLIVYLSRQFENRRPLTNQAHPRQLRWNLKIPSWKRRNIYKFTNHQFLDSMLIFGVFFWTGRIIHSTGYLGISDVLDAALPRNSTPSWRMRITRNPWTTWLAWTQNLLRNRWAPNMTRNKATLLVWWFGTCGNGLTTKALQQFHRWILTTCCLVVDMQPICRKWND